MEKTSSFLVSFSEAKHTSSESDNDIVSWAFANLQKLDPHRPIWGDARDTSKTITAGFAFEVIALLVRGLKEDGLQAGDCVTIHAANSTLYPLLWLAVLAAGGIVSGSNPASTPSELLHHLAITSTKFVLVHTENAKAMCDAAHKCEVSPQRVYLFEDSLLDCLSGSTVARRNTCEEQRQYPSAETRSENLFRSYLERTQKYGRLGRLIQQGEKVQTGFDGRLAIRPSDTALYCMTSGTTGLPKVAIIPHSALISQATVLETIVTSRAGPIRQLISLPMFHGFASICALVLPLRLGITTYLLPRFKIGEFNSAIQEHSITDILVVPPIVSALVQHGAVTELSTCLRSLRYVLCAGAPMNPHVQAELHQYLSSDCHVGQCWGTTESGWITLTPFRDFDRTGSVGEPIAGVQVKLVSAKGVPIHDDEVRGEAYVKSNFMFAGYRANDAATLLAIDSEGYYRTGDVAYFWQGRVFLQGRCKDIMKVRGWQVSPEELEIVIHKHEQVVDCAVVGMVQLDAAGLEQTYPRAYIVVKEGPTVDAEEIEKWVSARTMSYKHLSGGVCFVEEIPRNAAGKILRRKLVDV